MRQQSTGASWYGHDTGLTVITSPPGRHTRHTSAIHLHGWRTCSITWAERVTSKLESGAGVSYSPGITQGSWWARASPHRRCPCASTSALRSVVDHSTGTCTSFRYDD